MVYLIDLGTCYKIGVTTNLKKRIETFKNSREIVTPIDVIVYPQNTIDIEKIDKNIESDIHKLCQKYKISRELFQKTQEVVEIFQDYKFNKIQDFTDWTLKFNEILNPLKKEKIKIKSKSTKQTRNNDSKSLINKSKLIYQYDLKGNFIKEWQGITQIEKELKFDGRGIDKNLQGIFHKSHGYIWSLTKLSDEDLKEKVKNAIRYNNYSTILQYSKDNKLISKFNSLTEASQSTGISISSISLCCQGRYKTAGNYIWKKGD